MISQLRIAYAFLVLFACLFVSAQNSPRSEREKADVDGPVSRMKIELAAMSYKNGKLVESGRHLMREVEFDKTGKILADNEIPTYGSPITCEAEYKYDARKRPTVYFCKDDPGERILEKYTYEDDSHGNWIKKIASVPDGDGFRVQWTMYRKITYFQ